MDSFGQSHFDPQRQPYSSSSAAHSFRLDEGFSEDASSQDEHGRSSFATTAARFQEWVMAQNEDARAEIAYEVLRTLRTSNIAGVVERLTPLLHMDPLEKLPPEITAQIFSYLDANTLLIASLASHTWRARIMDSMLWQDLYKSQGWGLDGKEIRLFESAHSSLVRHEFKKARAQLPGQPQSKKRATSEWLESRGRKVSADVSHWREQHGAIEADEDMQSEDDQEMQDAPTSIHNSPQRPNKRQSHDSGDEMDYSDNERVVDRHQAIQHLDPPLRTRMTTYDSSGREKLNWVHLYKQRQKLEQNWTKGRYNTFQLPHPSYPHEAHTECVYTIQFFGKWLVSGSRDKTLRVWDLETRRLRGKPLTGHSQSVLCLQFDPTEKEDVIISGSSDSSVIIWRFSTGQKIHEIPSAHEESVLNLRFDHRYLVTCSKDRRIKIWNRKPLTATDRDYPRVRHDSQARVPSYIVNVDEMEPSLLEARMVNGTIRALKPYMLLMTLEGHNAAVNAIQINGDLIVSASGDRLIKVWNAKTGKIIRTLQGHQKGIACVQFDSKRIVSGSSDNTVRIYDPFTSAEVAELKGHTNLVRTVQAGFGDTPGSDEDDNSKANEASRKYLEDLANGLIVEDKELIRRIKSGENGTSRLALGSKLPPGGGGSKWGRIVSGSYDESIIIWRKNARGDWVIGQMLRQEPVAQFSAADARPRPNLQAPGLQNPPPPVLIAPVVGPVQATNGPSSAVNVGPAGAVQPGVMSASQIVQHAMGTSFASLGAGLSNVMGIGRALNVNGPASVPRNGMNLSHSFASSSGNGNPQSIAHATSGHPQDAVSRAVQVALAQAAHRAQTSQGTQSQYSNQPSTQPQPTATPAHLQPPSQPHPPAQQQGGPAQAPTPPAAVQGQPGPAVPTSSVSRVFKLQFDARRIVCCSQDSRIVGWDFANGDAEIVEACRFFVGP